MVIDPGVALGYRRHGLLPHPIQVAVGAEVRRSILDVLADATDVVFSHFHGDHVPLPDANPYQIDARAAAPLCRAARFWTRGSVGMPDTMLARRQELCNVLGCALPDAEGRRDGPLAFSTAVPHGEQDSGLGSVMMTRIEDAETVFVHASDIQLLRREGVEMILDWHPDIVLAGGPPLYLPQLSADQRDAAWGNALLLACGVDTLILDHHLLRSMEGLDWLDRLSQESGHRVICAADFMGRPRRLLEARRGELYRQHPVPERWHADHAAGKIRPQ